ncbi:MAG: DUF342 domain-containing protein [Firmicutes bacterium]|nr:DUF342 domain-containing protein [Bacillota bacterium]
MDTKKQYREKMEAQLDEWKAELNKLKAKVQQTKADKEIELINTIEDIQGKRSEAQDKLNELKDTGEENWEALKEQLDEFGKDIKDSLNNLMSKIN